MLFQVDYRGCWSGQWSLRPGGRLHTGLATVDPDAFGMVMATFDGEIYGVGQVERPFSIQSVSKLFSPALLLAEIGDRVWQGVSPGPRPSRGSAAPTPSE